MIKINRTETQITVASDYNPDLPIKAKNLGGRWDSAKRVWIFDIRDEEKVAELYLNIYGEWDAVAKTGDTLTVRITATRNLDVKHGGIYFAGRQLASATGRDSGARLGGGVIKLGGDAYSSGSVKNWYTTINSGTVFEVKDVPARKIEDEKDNTDWNIEVIGSVDTAALQEEKARLLARISEIDVLLGAK